LPDPDFVTDHRTEAAVSTNKLQDFGHPRPLLFPCGGQILLCALATFLNPPKLGGKQVKDKARRIAANIAKLQGLLDAP